jgi:uncharacterized protein YjbJ (UPF0337 family)
MKSRWNIAAENWDELTQEMKSKWELLTDDELAEINGDREVLVRKLQGHYGFARYEASKMIDAWIDKRRS